MRFLSRSVVRNQAVQKIFGVTWMLLVASSFTLEAAGPIRKLLEENRLEEAMGLCRQFELLSTNDHDNLFACTWVYYRADKLDSAEKMREKTKPYYRLPEYQLLTAYSAIAKKQYREAEKLLDTIRMEHKGTAIGLTAEEIYAETKELEGDAGSAAFIYKQVVAVDKNRNRSHWGLGRYYLSRGENRLAIFHLETTALLWPKHKASRFNLGVLHLSLENLPEATRWLIECNRLDKADPGVLEQLGILFEKKNMITQAVRFWQRAVDVKPDSPIAREKLSIYAVNIIDSLIDSGKFQEALSKLENSKAFDADQKNLFRRGICYKHLQKYDKAAADLKAYLATGVTDPTANRELGISYYNMRLDSQAEAQFRKALGSEPTNGLNYAWLGYVLESKKDLDGASEAWRKAIDLLKDPKDLERATRRLSSVERRMNSIQKKEKKKQRKNSMEMGLDLPEPPPEDEEEK